MNNRKIRYLGCDNSIRMKEMSAGVPQGSILGPLLWNLTFNRVLEAADTKLLKGCHLICYADDTILLTRGVNPQSTIDKAKFCATRIIRVIEELGLEVASNKTEAMIFSKKRLNTDSYAITIGNHTIPIKLHMKYLGIMIDNNWSFKNHFLYVEEKASKVVRALWKIMPNLRGPGETKRKLYSHVVHSVLLYGAPV